MVTLKVKKSFPNHGRFFIWIRTFLKYVAIFPGFFQFGWSMTLTGFRHPNRQAKYLYIKLQTLFVCPIITQGPICLKFWLRNLVGSRECCDFGFEILSWVVLLLYEKTAKIVIYDKARVGSNLEYLVGISRIPTYSTNCLWEITETFKLGLASITTNT